FFEPITLASVSCARPPRRSQISPLPLHDALPILEFMKAYIDARPDKDDPPTFEAPGNIVFLAVDKSNGRKTMLPGASKVGGSSLDRKSTRLNSSHVEISYAVFCLKQKKQRRKRDG